MLHGGGGQKWPILAVHNLWTAPDQSRWSKLGHIHVRGSGGIWVTNTGIDLDILHEFDGQGHRPKVKVTRLKTVISRVFLFEWTDTNPGPRMWRHDVIAWRHLTFRVRRQKENGQRTAGGAPTLCFVSNEPFPGDFWSSDKFIWFFQVWKIILSRKLDSLISLHIKLHSMQINENLSVFTAEHRFQSLQIWSLVTNNSFLP